MNHMGHTSAGHVLSIGNVHAHRLSIPSLSLMQAVATLGESMSPVALTILTVKHSGTDSLISSLNITIEKHDSVLLVVNMSVPLWLWKSSEAENN